MRSLLVVCLLAGAAHAGPQPLPVDVVTQARVGDWAIYEGERRQDGKLVPERVVVRVHARAADGVALGWFTGPKDHEVWSDGFAQLPTEPVTTDMLGAAYVDVRDFAAAAATCTLGSEIACQRVTFGVGPFGARPDPATDGTVVVTLAPRVRATGVVSLEVTDGAGVARRLHVVGYGRGDKSEWGIAASRSALTAPKLPEGSAVYGDLLAGSDTSHPVRDHWSGFGLSSEGTWRGAGGTPATALASLSKDAIRVAIRQHLGPIRTCYEKALMAKPDLAGTVRVKFVIGPTGAVTSATATGVDPDVASCVARAVQAIAFPAPTAGPMTVDYPFVFSPG